MGKRRGGVEKTTIGAVNVSGRGSFVAKIAAVCVIAVGAALVFYLLFVYDSRKDLALETFVPEVGASDYEFMMGTLSGLTDKTEEMCSGSLTCNQAFVGDRVSLLRFDTKDDALAYYVEARGRAYQSGWIVIDYTDPEITDEERFDLQNMIDQTWASGD